MSRRITHIGIVVQNLEAAIQLWMKNYGFKEVYRMDLDEEGVHTAMLSPTGSRGEMSIELIEPKDKSDMRNAIARRLACAGEGFFHLAITVEDVDTSRKLLAARGVKVIERPPVILGEGLRDIVAPEAKRCVVHPKSSNGILVELLQSRKGL